jgi:peptide-methionine (R)-S-oxide reductase
MSSALRFTRRRALLLAAGLPLIASDAEPEVTIVEFSDKGERLGTSRVKKVIHTEDEWRKLLTLKQFYATRKANTDLAFSGSYYKLRDAGLYRCIGCGTAVFSSEAKFDAKNGLPAFSAPIAEENIRTRSDTDTQFKRTEVLCRRCDSHLGYLYEDGPILPGHHRYCINESSVKFFPYRGHPGQASGTSPINNAHKGVPE